MENGIVQVGGIGITLADITIVLLALIFFFVGHKKGFINQLFGLFGTLAAIAGAIALCGVVGGWLNDILGDVVREPLQEWVAGLGSGTDPNVFQTAFDWSDEAVRNSQMATVLEQMGLPSLAAGLLAKPIGGIFEGFGFVALSDVLADTLTGWAMTAIAFIILLVVFFIILALLRKMFNGAIKRVKVFAATDRFLGAILALVKLYVIASVILAIILILPANWGITESINGHIQASAITKFLYENNLIAVWLLSVL